MARPASKKEKTFTSYESLARELLPSEENPSPLVRVNRIYDPEDAYSCRLLVIYNDGYEAFIDESYDEPQIDEQGAAQDRGPEPQKQIADQ